VILDIFAYGVCSISCLVNLEIDSAGISSRTSRWLRFERPANRSWITHAFSLSRLRHSPIILGPRNPSRLLTLSLSLSLSLCFFLFYRAITYGREVKLENRSENILGDRGTPLLPDAIFTDTARGAFSICRAGAPRIVHKMIFKCHGATEKISLADPRPNLTDSWLDPLITGVAPVTCPNLRLAN